MNRRIRNRTYGGVRGRGLKGPLLLDRTQKGDFFLTSKCFLPCMPTLGQLPPTTGRRQLLRTLCEPLRPLSLCVENALTPL
jgi:hypothetical protein